MASKGTTSRSALRRGQLLIMFACCAALYGPEAEAAPAVSETVVMRDSSEFGYLVDRGIEEIRSKEVIPAVNSNLQSFTGIDITGDTSNPETAVPITRSRCGFEDILGAKTGGRTKRWTYGGSKRQKKYLTYRIDNYTSQLNKTDVDQTIAEAFAMWSDHADLTFAPGNEEADIVISFERGEHGDGYPFKGSSDVTLAHAFYPKKGNIIHFNDDHNWTTSGNRDQGYNLLATAVHEIGHSLGLAHNDDTSSVMYGGVSSFHDTLTLTSDDIKSIQALYGPKTAAGNVRQFCADPRVDAILLSADGHRYVFKGENYWELTDYGFAAGYPKLIYDNWIGFSGNVDLAYTDDYGDTYFHRGSKIVRYVGRRKFKVKKDRTPAIQFQWNSFIEAQKRLHSLTMRDFCFSDSVRSVIRATRVN